MTKLLLPFLSCILLQATEQTATNDTPEFLSTLSLEDLMNVEITSTSRRPESQHLASGIVTVVSAQEIHQYGARHLRDVIDRLVGIQIGSSHQWGHTKASIRGMNSAHNEGSVLLLLNGRPMREATDGGVNFDIYQGFPLETIDHIEVVRGPGSVIYGTNAMAGVINIITKNAKNSINESQVDIGAGSFNRRQLQLTTLIGDADYSLNIGVNSIRSHGDDIDGVTDKDGIQGTYVMDEKSDNLLINGNYKNFTLNAMIMDNAPSRANSNFQLPSQQVDKRRYFFDIGYLYDIAPGWDTSINYTTSVSDLKWQIREDLGRNHYHDRSEMLETIVRGNVYTDLNILFGANYVTNSTAFDRFLDPIELYNVSAYTQIDYMLSPKQKIIGGVQWNKPEANNADYSARAGFIQGFGDNFWIKLLYSEAFRSPNFVETYLVAAALTRNPNLAPEHVKTYDLQFIYQTPKHYLGLTLYDTMHKDLIVRTSSTPPSHENQGFVRYQGIELEGRTNIYEGINLIGNFSYQTNKTDNGIKDSTFAPKMMLKTGINYERIHGMNIGVFNSYIGTSTDLNATQPNAPAINPKADAYNLLSANISIDTAKMWGIGKTGHSLIALYLDNLLDEEVYAPDLNFGNQTNTIPHHWGRSANLTYTYKF
ncbi:MAG: TonB-dependent receptor plug domain-containing protein [Sulfuricurvum sp.]